MHKYVAKTRTEPAGAGAKQIHEHKWLGAPLSPTAIHLVLEVPRIPAFTLNLTHFGRRHASHTHHTTMPGLQTGHASQHGA